MVPARQLRAACDAAWGVRPDDPDEQARLIAMGEAAPVVTPQTAHGRTVGILDRRSPISAAVPFEAHGIIYRPRHRPHHRRPSHHPHQTLLHTHAGRSSTVRRGGTSSCTPFLHPSLRLHPSRRRLRLRPPFSIAGMSIAATAPLFVAAMALAAASTRACSRMASEASAAPPHCCTRVHHADAHVHVCSRRPGVRCGRGGS